MVRISQETAIVVIGVVDAEEMARNGSTMTPGSIAVMEKMGTVIDIVYQSNHIYFNVDENEIVIGLQRTK